MSNAFFFFFLFLTVYTSLFFFFGKGWGSGLLTLAPYIADIQRGHQNNRAINYTSFMHADCHICGP